MVHLRAALRLHRRAQPLRSVGNPNPSGKDATVNVVRIQEQINGRPYLIEVLPVGHDRWRAHILRAPGATTALMPFYGPTPDAAAEGLLLWLHRACGTPSTP
jgi:hypothetical protein